MHTAVYAPTLKAIEDTIMSLHLSQRKKSYRFWMISMHELEGNMRLGMHLVVMALATSTAMLWTYSLPSSNSFHQKQKHKAAWIFMVIWLTALSPGEIRDVCNVNVMCSAECDTDHKLLCGKFKLQCWKETPMEGVKVQKRINGSKLSDIWQPQFRWQLGKFQGSRIPNRSVC